MANFHERFKQELASEGWEKKTFNSFEDIKEESLRDPDDKTDVASLTGGAPAVD